MPLQPNVRDQGRALLADAKESGRDLADRAGQRARSSADDTKRRTTHDLKSVASALRSSDLGQREESLLGPVVGRVADQVDRAADFLETHSVDQITRDVGKFARRNPALFLGGCFAAGVLVARFLKASRGREQRAELPSYGTDVDARGLSDVRSTRDVRSTDDVRGAGSYGNDLDTF